MKKPPYQIEWRIMLVLILIRNFAFRVSPQGEL